jgi:hypothetical protein
VEGPVMEHSPGRWGFVIERRNVEVVIGRDRSEVTSRVYSGGTMVWQLQTRYKVLWVMYLDKEKTISAIAIHVI